MDVVDSNVFLCIRNKSLNQGFKTNTEKTVNLAFLVVAVSAI